MKPKQIREGKDYEINGNGSEESTTRLQVTELPSKFEISPKVLFFYLFNRSYRMIPTIQAVVVQAIPSEPLVKQPKAAGELKALRGASPRIRRAVPHKRGGSPPYLC